MYKKYVKVSVSRNLVVYTKKSRLTPHHVAWMHVSSTLFLLPQLLNQEIKTEQKLHAKKQQQEN